MLHSYNNYLINCNTLYKKSKKNVHLLNLVEYLNINFEFPENLDQFTIIKGAKVEKNTLNTQLNLLFLIYITVLKKPVINFNKKKNNFLFNLFVYRNKLNLFLLNTLGVLKPFIFLNYNTNITSKLFYFKSFLLIINKMNANSKLNLDLKNLRNFLFFFNFKMNY